MNKNTNVPEEFSSDTEKKISCNLRAVGVGGGGCWENKKETKVGIRFRSQIFAAGGGKEKGVLENSSKKWKKICYRLRATRMFFLGRGEENIRVGWCTGRATATPLVFFSFFFVFFTPCSSFLRPEILISGYYKLFL